MPGTSSLIQKASHLTHDDVFEDLNLTRAQIVEAKVKADLWRELVAHITPLSLTQKELARRLGVHQPEVSHLLSGKLSRFSAGTLIQYAVKLDMGIQWKITPPRPIKAKVKSLSAAGATKKRRTRPTPAITSRAA